MIPVLGTLNIRRRIIIGIRKGIIILTTTQCEVSQPGLPSAGSCHQLFANMTVVSSGIFLNSIIV